MLGFAPLASTTLADAAGSLSHTLEASAGQFIATNQAYVKTFLLTVEITRVTACPHSE